MAADYKTYLAANVLNEGNTITYRSLSHAFKIHANAAKAILAEFHTVQNAKSPGSVHATYLMSGFQEAPVLGPPAEEVMGMEGVDATQQTANTAVYGGSDVPMSSNPLPSSSMPPATEEAPKELRLVLTLVREEGLAVAKAKYNGITAIHAYSLAPVSPKDLQVISTANRQIALNAAEEDLLESYKQYGIIQNPAVKRRPTRGPVAKVAANPFKADNSAPLAKSAPNPSRTTAPAAPKAVAKPALKKENSDLFKSFAKAKSKEQPKSVVAKSDTQEDVSMRDVSDDDENEEPAAKPDLSSTKRRDARQNREAALKAMMEDDDDPVSNPDYKDDGSGEDAEPEPEPESEPEPIDEPMLQKSSATPAGHEEPTNVTTSGGRRRGRRKVMKKTTMKDEEGFLITKEDPAWESFSEEESVAPAAKVKSVPPSSNAKAGGPKGQGNIMSFFGRK